MAFIVHGASPFGGAGDALAGPEIHTPNLDNHLLCVGCGNFRAADEAQLREHYKSEWHRHNLKRKLANLAPITQEEFDERVQAYVGESNERGKKKEHLGNKAREKAEKRAAKLRERTEAASAAQGSGAAEAGGREEPMGSVEEDQPNVQDMTEEEFMDWKLANSIKLAPGDSLFDRHSCDDLATNLEYMAVKFGFFVPYIEHVEDLQELMHYVGQKVSVGNCCLWCNKSFHSMEAVQKHMVDKAHCKLCLEGNEEEFEDFYNISLYDEEEDDWSTDEEEEIDEVEEERISSANNTELRNQKGKLAEAARLSKKMNKSVTELTVSGAGGAKVLGHRAFHRYYRQSLRPELQAGGGETSRKIVALIADAYAQRGVMTRFQGSSMKAKMNRQFQKQDRRFEEKNTLRVQIKKNKFHQVRREDYHC